MDELAPVIVWFRRDLRLADQPALHRAVATGAPVVPLFVLDDRLLDRSRTAEARIWFLVRALRALDEDLRARGSRLFVARGRPEIEVPRLAAEIGAAEVLASRDVTEFGRRRDRAVRDALASEGRALKLLPGLLLVEPEQSLTADGSPYRVFSPFWRGLQQVARRELAPAPEVIPTPASLLERPDALPDPLPAPFAGLPEPTETAARDRLESWVGGRLSSYDEHRNALDGSGTSHLGADLHLGLLSPLLVETVARESAVDATPFVRQLAWREFYHHLAFHGLSSPQPMRSEALMSAFRVERDDPGAVEAWREGQTGIPTVDAAMRQLVTTSWLSNRARLVTASFLTRHLLMDPWIGERHFMRHLIDGDVANNRGGWLWSAGIGADPQPWFRIFNPVLQGRRFDPDGAWVRRWIPELDSVPDRYVHAPWEMSDEVAEAAGVRLGETYPRPIVDLAWARERALAAFRSATGRER